MIKLDLSFWQAGPRLDAVKRAGQGFWEQVEDWMRWPLAQLDVETCSLRALNLIAWGRDITRFKGEPEWLYRRRVKYAYVNARDAGSVAGFLRILERLDVGYAEIEERDPYKDWDVIILRLTDSQLSNYPELLTLIVHQYGRTCRRYEFEVVTPVPVGVVAIEFNNVWDYDQATTW